MEVPSNPLILLRSCGPAASFVALPLQVLPVESHRIQSEQQQLPLACLEVHAVKSSILQRVCKLANVFLTSPITPMQVLPVDGYHVGRLVHVLLHAGVEPAQV